MHSIVNHFSWCLDSHIPLAWINNLHIETFNVNRYIHFSTKLKVLNENLHWSAPNNHISINFTHMYTGFKKNSNYNIPIHTILKIIHFISLWYIIISNSVCFGMRKWMLITWWRVCYFKFIATNTCESLSILYFSSA